MDLQRRHSHTMQSRKMRGVEPAESFLFLRATRFFNSLAQFCRHLQAAPGSARKHNAPRALFVGSAAPRPRSRLLLEPGGFSGCRSQTQVYPGGSPWLPPLTPIPCAPHRPPDGRTLGSAPGCPVPGGPDTPRLPISSDSGSTSATWCSGSSEARSPRTLRPAAGRSLAQPWSPPLSCLCRPTCPNRGRLTLPLSVSFPRRLLPVFSFFAFSSK